MNNPSNQFEFIRLYPNLSSDPITGRAGEMYYNTTLNEVRYYNGSEWNSIGAGSGGGANTTLSNLISPTAVNQDLLPEVSGTYNLGNPSLYWDIGTVNQFLDSGSELSIDTFARILADDTGTTQLTWSTAGVYINTAINLNGLMQSGLQGPFTILDNQGSFQNLVAYDYATYPFAVLEYSILRNGIYRIGWLFITNDGTNTSDADDFNQTADTGIVLSSVISGSNVQVQYMSTSTGFNAVFKYSIRGWS